MKTAPKLADPDQPFEGGIEMRARLIAPAVTALLLSNGAAFADGAGGSWSSSYDFSSSDDRYARGQTAHLMKRAEEGYYDNVGKTTYNYTTNVDRSVGSVSVGDGSQADIDFRTGEESGTSTYTVGAVNNSETNVTVDGEGNIVDVENAADSEGCQDGSIDVSSVSGLDISSGASASNSSSGGC